MSTKKTFTIGDAFLVERGMTVYTMVPNKVIYKNQFLSNEYMEREINIGQVYKSDVDVRTKLNYIIGEIQACVKSESGLQLDFANVDEMLCKQISVIDNQDFSTSQYMGIYVVTQIEIDIHKIIKLTATQLSTYGEFKLDTRKIWFYSEDGILPYTDKIIDNQNILIKSE